jgi:hypothetical protein
MADNINLPSSQLKKLRIYQLNCNASYDCQLIMLNSLSPQDWDLIMIQEPYIAFNDVTRATAPPGELYIPGRTRKTQKQHDLLF